MDAPPHARPTPRAAPRTLRSGHPNGLSRARARRGGAGLKVGTVEHSNAHSRVLVRDGVIAATDSGLSLPHLQQDTRADLLNFVATSPHSARVASCSKNFFAFSRAPVSRDLRFDGSYCALPRSPRSHLPLIESKSPPGRPPLKRYAQSTRARPGRVGKPTRKRPAPNQPRRIDAK